MHRLCRRADFSPGPESRQGVLAYRRAMAPESAVRLGLISNPMAKTNWRSRAHAKLSRIVPDPGACVSTPSLGDLSSALRHLLFVQHRNVLTINGGDGTIHHTLNAVLSVIDEASARHDLELPLPHFLFVNGGGMNMLARTLGTRGHPVRTLRRFLSRHGWRSLGQIQTRPLPMLEVCDGDGVRRCGFIWGSELVMNALTMYERYGQGYQGLARLLTQVALGPTFRTDEWRQFGHLLDAPRTSLHIDDDVIERYTSVVATTIPMVLAKGLIGTFRRGARPGRLVALAVTETDAPRVIKSIPALLRGREHAAVSYYQDVQRLTVHGTYTIDGERFSRPAVGGLNPSVTVHGSPVVIDGITLD